MISDLRSQKTETLEFISSLRNSKNESKTPEFTFDLGISV